MPFMRGPAPIRRTLEYLERNNLVLKDRVKIFAINYNIYGENHEGAREFVFWHLPQLQYKNPNIQIATFKNLTPSPFIQCYLGEKIQFYFHFQCKINEITKTENGEEILMDVDGQTKDQIFDRIKNFICKSE